MLKKMTNPREPEPLIAGACREMNLKTHHRKTHVAEDEYVKVIGKFMFLKIKDHRV